MEEPKRSLSEWDELLAKLAVAERAGAAARNQCTHSGHRAALARICVVFCVMVLYTVIVTSDYENWVYDTQRRKDDRISQLEYENRQLTRDLERMRAELLVREAQKRITDYSKILLSWIPRKSARVKIAPRPVLTLYMGRPSLEYPHLVCTVWDIECDRCGQWHPQSMH